MSGGASRAEPLAGRTVLVTRPAERADGLATMLRERGAEPILAPAVELAPVRSAALTGALEDLADGAFDWIVLTSPATVAMLTDRLGDPGRVRARVAAIGDGTAATFRRWTGRDLDLQPDVFTTAALARAFPRGAGRVLCARTDIAPEGLEERLSAKGWTPLRVDAYRTRPARMLPAEAGAALRRGAIDAVTFTSASTVRGLLGIPAAAAALTGADPSGRLTRASRPGRPKVVCIGPITAREARDRGLRVHAVARPHTAEGLVGALERAFTPRRRATIDG